MSNPMNSRCGLEGCDCGYAIDKLLEALEGLMPWMGTALADNAFAGCVLPLAANKATEQAQATIDLAKGDA